MIHLEATDEFDYTPVEKYVADRLRNRSEPDSSVRWYDFFPIRQAMVLRRSLSARSAIVTPFAELVAKIDAMEKAWQAQVSSASAQGSGGEGAGVSTSGSGGGLLEPH